MWGGARERASPSHLLALPVYNGTLGQDGTGSGEHGSSWPGQGAGNPALYFPKHRHKIWGQREVVPSRALSRCNGLGSLEAGTACRAPDARPRVGKPGLLWRAGWAGRGRSQPRRSRPHSLSAPPSSPSSESSLSPVLNHSPRGQSVAEFSKHCKTVLGNVGRRAEDKVRIVTNPLEEPQTSPEAVQRTAFCSTPP